MTGATLSTRLEACYTGAVYDVMRDRGHRQCVLPNRIRPIDEGLKLAGPAWTTSGRFDETASDDDTFMAWTGVLSAAPDGSVIVCQPNDSSLAHMGELSAEALKSRNVRGYVVDGGCRDVDFIRRLQWPVFCRYFTPVDVVGRWLAEGLGEPIVIGDVAIATGDYILGDVDGVVVIPAELTEEVISRTEAIINTESELRREILDGMDPQEAYKKYRLF